MFKQNRIFATFIDPKFYTGAVQAVNTEYNGGTTTQYLKRQEKRIHRLCYR